MEMRFLFFLVYCDVFVRPRVQLPATACIKLTAKTNQQSDACGNLFAYHKYGLFVKYKIITII